MDDGIREYLELVQKIKPGWIGASIGQSGTTSAILIL
jgi:hypothetical protein